MSNSLLDDLGRVDNLSDPEPPLNRKEVILAVIITFLALSCICALGRLWIRVFVTHTPGLDDVFLLLSVLANIAGAPVLCILAVSGGLGKHYILLGKDGMLNFLRTFYVANGIYPIAATFIKLALLFQYLRILEKGSKLRRVTIIVIAVVSLWGIAFFFLSFIPSVPVNAFWDITIPDDRASRYGFGSHDINVVAGTYIGEAASNMFLDVVVFAIPLPLWLGKNIEAKTRTALLGLFVLGAIVNACSICRLISLIDTRAGTWPTLDPSWYGSSPIVLAALEVYLAMICASLPVFWPIIKESWETRKIVVTHEVEVTREPRKFSESIIMDEYDLRSTNFPPMAKPREFINRSYPYEPSPQTISPMIAKTRPELSSRGIEQTWV